MANKAKLLKFICPQCGLPNSAHEWGEFAPRCPDLTPWWEELDPPATDSRL